MKKHRRIPPSVGVLAVFLGAPSIALDETDVRATNGTSTAAVIQVRVSKKF